MEANEGDTELVLKKITPVRLLKNDFYSQVKNAENDCVDTNTLSEILGRARAKKGMFEGDMVEGELEIGQISALIDDITPAGIVVNSMWSEFNSLLQAFQGIY